MSSKQWHGGKGSQQRSGNDEQYRSNWDRIFGEKCKHQTEDGCEIVDICENDEVDES